MSKVHVLDTRQLGRAGIIAATALETSDGIALFDTGPESTFENVAAELRSHGFEPKDVRHVFVSHIHFDHAGGLLLRRRLEREQRDQHERTGHLRTCSVMVMGSSATETRSSSAFAALISLKYGSALRISSA